MSARADIRRTGVAIPETAVTSGARHVLRFAPGCYLPVPSGGGIWRFAAARFWRGASWASGSASNLPRRALRRGLLPLSSGVTELPDPSRFLDKSGVLVGKTQGKLSHLLSAVTSVGVKMGEQCASKPRRPFEPGKRHRVNWSSDQAALNLHRRVA